jgi:hypothetical protein
VRCRAGTLGAYALLLSVCVVASFAVAGSHAAASDRAAARAEAMVPLPPPRPVEFGGRRPDVITRGLQEVPTPAPATVAVATMPRALPPASRERMQECGREWQQIKWSGSAGERTWRDFAMECLPR